MSASSDRRGVPGVPGAPEVPDAPGARPPGSERWSAFTLTAHLQQGASLDARFGITLDGMLASQVRTRAKRDMAPAVMAEGDLGDLGGLGDAPVPGSLLDGGQHAAEPAEVALPLARCARGKDWHWMATTAYPVGHDGAPLAVAPDVHHLNSRHAHRTNEVVSLTLPAVISASSGRYRSRRMPVVTFPAAALTWRGVGDVEQVLALVAPLASIGARRGVGEGAVLRWEVQAATAGPADAYGHLHLDGRLGRPVPAACAQALGLSQTAQGEAGMRPPYWHPARQRHQHLPTYAQP